jgi:hypothetical protein
MMLTEPKPDVLVLSALLLAVRDGYDLIRVERAASLWYDMSGQWLGHEEPLIGPSHEAAQAFPEVLAGLCGKQKRRWNHLTRWARRLTSLSETGQFRLSIGRGAATVDYCARWSNGVLATLDISVSASDAIAAAAHRELWNLLTLDEDESGSHNLDQ